VGAAHRAARAGRARHQPRSHPAVAACRSHPCSRPGNDRVPDHAPWPRAPDALRIDEAAELLSGGDSSCCSGRRSCETDEAPGFDAGQLPAGLTTPPDESTEAGAVPLTPNPGSWLNLVEAFFSILTRQALRRGSFPTVADLIAAIQRFIDAWNDRCRPLTWTKDPDTVIAKATHPRRRKTQQTSDTEH
jgi:hypothetical protein